MDTIYLMQRTTVDRHAGMRAYVPVNSFPSVISRLSGLVKRAMTGHLASAFGPVGIAGHAGMLSWAFLLEDIMDFRSQPIVCVEGRC